MTNLRKLVFSPNLKAIESGAFAGCFLLEELVIPESMTDIGRGERLEAAAHAALDSNDATTAAGPPAAGAGDDSAGPPAAGADDGEEPMYLPVEMWLHI
eukprot:gene27033-3302_t